ncbi:MAG: 2'-5' RNA ligase family protein [Sphingomonadaceae bacterium]
MSIAPIIVTALFGAEDFHWLDEQRRAYFPPERNVLRAHLTMFHHLPPSCEAELLGRLRSETLAEPPRARIDSIFSLGQGVAYRVDSLALEYVRASLADAFTGMLTPQDQSPWRPHVTIQNKVKPAVAKALMTQLLIGFRERPLSITGLAAWYYRGGPWEPIAAYRFGGGRPMAPPKSLA